MKLTDRRRRLKRPVSLVIFGILFLVLPLINYISLAARFSVQIQYPGLVLEQAGWIRIGLLILPVFIGIGLLLVRKWGWYLFLTYAVFLIGWNLFLFFAESSVFNFAAVIQSFLGVIAVIFFTSRDISAPYMKMYPRGWRMQLRRPVQIAILIDGKRKQTRDISEVGAYVKWRDCDLEPNSEVNLSLNLGGNARNLRAGVVRVDRNGAGLAFRGMSREERRSLRRDLQAAERRSGA